MGKARDDGGLKARVGCGISGPRGRCRCHVSFRDEERARGEKQRGRGRRRGWREVGRRSLTQSLDGDLPGEGRRKVDAQVHVLMQEHFVNAAGVEGDAHLLSPALAFLLRAAHSAFTAKPSSFNSGMMTRAVRLVPNAYPGSMAAPIRLVRR